VIKKDLNYIAGVEKAIAKKYGRVAAQDFRDSWTPDMEREYLQQLKERNKKIDSHSTRKERKTLGEVIITTRSSDIKTTRTCPVCKTYSFSLKDDLYMNRFRCCFGCYLDFVIARESDWESGKRPSEEQIMLIRKRRKNNG
jgi:hypothetical protein